MLVTTKKRLVAKVNAHKEKKEAPYMTIYLFFENVARRVFP
jgi:hypothetical protein